MELSKIIIIQLVGYLLKSSGVLTPITEAGIGHYVGTIAFPCVLFMALANLDFAEPDLFPVLAAIVLAKLLVFMFALLFGKLTTPASAAPGLSYTRSALFAIYATQSDDIGIGLPVLTALFGNRVDSLYALSATQALVFNPLAYTIMGFGASRAAAGHAKGHSNQ